MITSAAKRIRLNECAELATRTSLIWMLFGMSDHIFNIHDVQLIVIFISLTKIKDIVENLDELPNRILPNLAHLLILCVFTSVLCGVNKEVKENNNNNKKPNPILAFYMQTRGADNNLKGKKTHKITSRMSSTECELSNFCLKLLQCTRSIGRG